MGASAATLRETLAAIVGDAHLLVEAHATAPYLVDARNRFHGAALAVVRPDGTDEVAAVVRACAGAGVTVVAQGGNTGLCGGATPDPSGGSVVVSLARMRRIRSVDPANATVTVEAGATLAEVQAAAAAAGLRFPLSLASEGSCTIGGNIATNAGGTAVLRYGNTRAQVLGLEVVLADGRVWNGLRALRKDNTGYDLKQLFIGSEGTLGIVTAAVLTLVAPAHSRATALAALTDLAQAVLLLSRMKEALGDRLTGFELMSDVALGLSRKHHPDLPDPLPGHAWYALIQADAGAGATTLAADVEAALAEAIAADAADDATVAASGEQAKRLWALRENISEAQRREGPNVKHDIALPASAIPAFVASCGSALAMSFPEAHLVVFGHLGDGNLHYNVAAASGASAESLMHRAADINRIVYDEVNAHGGTISAEHGIGQLKREALARYRSPLELELMRRVKDALDPHGVFNPGKVLPDAARP
ncbi:MAG: FAD-binding oxidoreductase [Proteobacteria bacterium]|nr:FAD-binding oxidoreductase [Pseudomonadota bacterium]